MIGPVLGWFKDYLSGRTQRVVVEGVASTWSPVTSAVSQGSILGPLLFVIFINDLPDVVQYGAETAMYADDTKLHHKITSTDDCKCLQQSLTNLNSCSIQNNIHFNISKSKVLTITRKKTPVIYCMNINWEQKHSLELTAKRILASLLPPNFHGNFTLILLSPKPTKY